MKPLNPRACPSCGDKRTAVMKRDSTEQFGWCCENEECEWYMGIHALQGDAEPITPKLEGQLKLEGLRDA